MVRKCRAIIFNTDYTGELKKVGVKDGSIFIDGKEFKVDKAIPFAIKFGKMKKPEITYLCNWKSIVPMQFKPMEINNNGYREKTLVPFTMEEYKEKITPDILSETVDMRFMKHMKKYADEGKGKIGMENFSLILKIVFAVLLVFFVVTYIVPAFI